MSQSSQSFKFITHNFAFLNRSLNGPGLKVHAAEDNEFVTLTMSKCISNDTDYVLAENPQNVIYCHTVAHFVPTDCGGMLAISPADP